jgi:tetratricopeptide (TPR) repeat protein
MEPTLLPYPYDLALLPNPYDFANPVIEPALFAGRKKEQSEIAYYLDHAQRADRPINLALIGERASGKTSLLNLISSQATERDLCVVRIDLNEGDVRSPLTFFSKVFDRVLTSACERGVFGGLGGEIYDRFRQTVDTRSIPANRRHFPFIFPIQFARAAAAEITDTAVSDHVLRRDLDIIRRELGRAFVLLFDECDVLRRDRIILEQLRNIFMGTTGYMLVFAGTRNLFPVLDDVFSPILRQFKKINVEPFASLAETQSCIKKPLEKLGVKPERLWEHGYIDVRDIHEVSAGRPYEIQLLGHFLFRRLQERRADQMELTLEVLDEVLQELEASHDVWLRPVITAVKGLDPIDLVALRLLSACNGRATMEQLWTAEYIFNGVSSLTQRQLHESADRLISEGVLTRREDDTIQFSGDDFDRIYCKYYGQQHGIFLNIVDIPYSSHLERNLSKFLRAKHQDPDTQMGPLEEISSGARQILQQLSIADAAAVNPFDEAASDDGFEVYSIMTDAVASQIWLLTSRLTTPWSEIEVLMIPNPDVEDSVSSVQELSAHPEVREAQQRAILMGANLEVEVHGYPVVAPDVLFSLIAQSTNEPLKVAIGTNIDGNGVHKYVKDQDVEEAIAEVRKAYQLNPDPHVANDLAYLTLRQGDAKRAQQLLDAAAEVASYRTDIVTRSLMAYNQAMAQFMNSDDEAARHALQKSLEISSELRESSREVVCLLIPRVDPASGARKLEEVWDPDLHQTGQRALEYITGEVDGSDAVRGA